MPRRSSRRDPRSTWGTRRLLTVGVAALVLGGGILGLKWLETDDGRLFLAERDVGPARGWAEEHLEAAVRDGLRASGTPLDSLHRARPRLGEPVLMRLATDVPLLEVNRHVTAAVEKEGGWVHRGVRRHEERGDVLELHLGTPRHLTHRLVVRRGRRLPEPPPLPAGRIALVIDDVGHNVGPLFRRLLALDVPLTLAILPDLAHSGRALLEIERAEQQALLHMPMEPDPTAPMSAGPRAVEVGMSAAEVRELVATCLDELPRVEGLNNHMGSRATRSRPEMTAVMEVLAERGLIFLDSLTTPRSVAHEAAARLGVPHLKNDLFVDRETEDPARVLERLRQLAETARRRGWAVGIGHVNRATVEGLESFVADLEPTDIEMVFLADLVHDQAQAR